MTRTLEREEKYQWGLLLLLKDLLNCRSQKFNTTFHCDSHSLPILVNISKKYALSSHLRQS